MLLPVAANSAVSWDGELILLAHLSALSSITYITASSYLCTASL